MVIAVNFQFKQLERRSSNFRLLLFNCLNWKINCDDHSPVSDKLTVCINSFEKAENYVISIHGRYAIWVLDSVSYELCD